MDSELKIKTVSPPADLPIFKSKADWDATSFFGWTTFSDAFTAHRDVFGIHRFDRRQHLYIIGKTGVGKTKLIELLARADIARDHGICIIDPHGDLVQDLLDYIPEERAEDVVLIDPTDMDFPVAFNPIRKVPPEERHLVASGLIEAFRKQFGEQWTSRLEHVCRFTILALLEYEDATFADIMSMLTDPKFRQKVIPHITDDVIRRFWSLEFASWSERFDNEAIIPLVNRIGHFLSNPLIRHTLTQRQNKIDFDDFINSGKIVLVNLSKGIIGEENTELFGSLIITALYQATMRRAKIPVAERSDFYLYVDELQNVATQTFLNLFSESRKYGLNITVSHQHLSQLESKMSETVFGNVGTIIAFRVGAEDAARLSKEFVPVCEIEDLLNLGVREFVIKLSILGKVSDPFSGKTLTAEPVTTSIKEKILKLSRAKYARPINEVLKDFAQESAATTSIDEFIAPIV